MFGYLRFILAFFVLISHVDVRFFGLNPGVVAVVVFYILAGHVVARLWRDIIPGGRGKILRFYTDRLLRIFPLYLFVAFLTLLFLIATDYGQPQISLFKLLGNLVVIPLNFYMVMDTTILTTPNWCLIPPAWSLGAELQAYLVLPLVFACPRLKLLLVAGSLGIYLAASFSIIHPDYFGYRLVPGVFFIFALGCALESTRKENHYSRFDMVFPWAIWGGIGSLGILLLALKMFGGGYTRETFIGLLAGIPVVYALGRSSLRLPGNALMGGLSYGVFLSHFPVIWWLDYTGYVQPASVAYVPAVTLGALGVAGLGMILVERPVEGVRRNRTWHDLCFERLKF